MTQARPRFRAVHLTLQIAAAGTLASLIVGGCSSDVKTVTVECPMGGAPSFGGHAPLEAGNNSGPVAGGASPVDTAGEAGIGQSGESSGGESDAAGNAGMAVGGTGTAVGGQGGNAGNAGSAGRGGSAGAAGGTGTAGRAGAAGNAGRAGGSTTGGGTGNAGGQSGAGGAGNSGGANASGGKPAVCGDSLVTAPEFCDDHSNTDLSYGCYACTTLPAAVGAANAPQQCGDCLQSKSQPSSCFACADYRACYACLRLQPDDPQVSSSVGCGSNDRDDADSFTSPQSYSDRCFNPDNSEYQAATTGPAGSEPKGLVCQALVACILRTGCATGQVGNHKRSVWADCYCGPDPAGRCASDATFVPSGPCVNELRDANAPDAATTGPSLATSIAVHLGDPSPGNAWSALGVANQIVSCAADRVGCGSVCFPNSNNAGAGGTAGTAGLGGGSGHGGS